ncbi:MAG: diaminopimelate epimerase [Actinomycetota bacterium]|jgi:diaminopimelate epimerase
MRLRKYHGLGNDFLVLVDRDGSVPAGAAMARALCERHRGVGADGLIRVTPGPDGPVMELYNADGSRAETSGNGLRCVARAAVDARLATGPEVTITTDAGPRRARIRPDGLVSVEMGTATVDGQHVDMGNPHRVELVEDLAAVTGPDRPDLNVEYVVAGPGTGQLSMRVFERGVGETQACGSGACAAAAVAHAKGLVGPTVTVNQPGGAVTVELGDPVVLTGPAVFVFEAEVPWP